MSPEMETLTVTLEEEGERLDKLLANRFKETYSRTYFHSLLEEGLIRVNGEVVKKDTSQS